jgi:hypothetical protein
MMATLLITLAERQKVHSLEALAWGTVSGALDMMRALGYVCKLEGVTREQAKDAVLKYLADHPEKTKVATVFQIIPAMEAAIDCKAPAALQPR